MPTEALENSYRIKTTGFEGPFGLLLRLVEERKLFINDLSLAQVTEDYLNYINKFERLQPGEISSFVVIAATLILIKSKSLLPNLSLTDEEKIDIQNLEERLRLYKLFTQLGGNIKVMFGKKIIFGPEERKRDNLIFLPDNQITKNSMMILVRQVLGTMPQKISLPEIEVRKVISIEEMIEKLIKRIQNSIGLNFKDFAGKSRTREEKMFAIVSFLAILELIRNGVLNAVQENYSQDIFIEKQS